MTAQGSNAAGAERGTGGSIDDLGRRVLEAAPVIVLVLEPTGAIVHVNPFFERLTGWSLDEVRGKDWFETFLPERDRAHIRELFGRALSGEQTRDNVNPIVVKSGEEREIEWTDEVLRDASGAPSGLLAIGHDVTPRVQAEREARRSTDMLATSERRLAEAHRLAHLGAWEVDVASGDVWWSDEEYRLNGVDPSVRVTQERFIDLVHPADRHDFDRSYRLILEQGTGSADFRIVRPDGDVRYIHGVATVERGSDGRAVRVRGTNQDVTELRRAEAGASRALDLLRTVVANAPVVMYSLDRDGVFRLSEGRALQKVGLRAGEVVGRSAFELYDDVPGFRDAFQRALSGEQVHLESHTGGVAFEALYAPNVDERGRIDGVIGVAFDVTERQAADRALHESEQRLRLALDASQLGTWELDLQTMVGRYDAQYGRMLGYEPGEHEVEGGDDFRNRVHPDDLSRLLGIFDEFLKSGRERYTAEFRLRTKEGGWKWVLTHGMVVARDAGGKPIRMLGTHKDIDERKAAELDRVRALEEKETLLREIHHRVKNNLQIISSLLHLQGKQSKPPEVAFADVRRRLLAMSLVHQKLYLSPDLAHVDLGEYVGMLVEALSGTFETPTCRVLVPVRASVPGTPDQALPVGMIVCELVTNVHKYARRPEGFGTATVTLARDGDAVVLTVEDDGPGFPQGFAPANETTLGWQLIRTLTTQLHGKLAILAGKGARIEIRFPLLPPSQATG